MGHAELERRLRLAGRPARRREGVPRRHGHGLGAPRSRRTATRCTLRAMLSPDPFMGQRGYPLLLAAGETADGVTPLVDRQHPHDLFMELSASLCAGTRAMGAAPSSMPACPASRRSARRHSCTGPAAMMSPEAPITHHWLDSTHITFGVRHGGLGAGRLEARGLAVHGPRAGRGPLRHRAAAHGQHGAARELESRRELVAAGVLGRRREPRAARARGGRGAAVRERAVRARARTAGRSWSATLAWGHKDPSEGEATDALALEAAWVPAADWQLFARAEWIETPRARRR